jgi:hypothetical protein
MVAGRLVTAHVGSKERYGSADQVAVGNGICRTVGPAELREGVQLGFTTEDIPIEAKRFASGARQMEVRGRVGHPSMLCIP